MWKINKIGWNFEKKNVQMWSLISIKSYCNNFLLVSARLAIMITYCSVTYLEC